MNALARMTMIAGLASGTAFGQCESACADEKMMERAQVASLAAFEAPDIVDTAVEAGTFKTLAAALGAADLIDALKGDGPFTVFAPTDEAFAKLPEGTIATLLKPENKEMLRTILLYHVVAGNAMAETVVGQKYWTTLNGQRVEIAAKPNKVLIDNAKITATDIAASNGVIHVIDTVIMPSVKTIPEVAELAGSFGTLLAAVEAAGLSETLMGDGPFTVFAPTDAAFNALGSAVDDLLLEENRDKLAAVLTYHVVPGRVYSEQVVELTSAETVQGSSIDISVNGKAVKIDDATVVKADIEATNGVIHVINKVLMPSN